MVFFFDNAAARAATRQARLALQKRARHLLRGAHALRDTDRCANLSCASLLLMAFLLTTSAACAQGPVDGAIRGHISAVCGPYRPACTASSVQVHLSSTDLAVERDITSDKDGNFLLLRLPPGEYQLRATSSGAGHGTAVTTMELEGGDLDDVMLTLEPSTTTAAKAAPAATLASFEIQGQDNSLPIESRQWEDLAELDSEANEEPSLHPAASAGDDDQDDPASRRSSGDGAAASGLSYAGLPSIEGSFSVDGLSGDQSFRSGPRGAASGGASSGSSYQKGSVRSFRLLPRNFSAQYGMVGGLAAVTRSASTRLHGSAFLLTRESAWAATNPFSIATHYRDGVVTSEQVKPEGSMLQFGGSVGLPLSRTRVRRRRRSKMLHEREPLAMFASLNVLLHDDHIVSSPELATFFNLSPDQIALLANRGVGQVATSAALDYLDSLAGTTARHAYRVQGSLRFDAEPTVRDHLTAEYAGNRFDSPSGAALGQASDAVVARGTGSLGDSVVHVDAGSAHWLHTFTRNLNNELRGQIARDLDYQTPHAPLPQEPAIGPGGYAPQVSIAPNGFSYGTPTSMAPGAAGSRSVYPDELRFEMADTMQMHLGRHLLILGADWSRIHDRIDELAAQEGAFSYDSGTTNGKDGGLVDWITDYTFNVHAYPNGGCPSIDATVHYFCFRSFTQSFGATSTQFVTHNIAGFAEDAMRVRNNLTVTLGLRYDYTLLPKPQASNPLLDADIAADVTASNGPIHGATATFPEDRNNFGPRLSVAWSPMTLLGLPARRSRKKLPLFTVHLGYGLFYGHIPGATIRAALVDTALNVTTTHIRIRPTTITDCPQVTAVNQGFGYPCDYITTPPAAVSQTTSATVFASNYRVPAVQRGMLSVERSLGKRITVRASYAMAMATQLPGSTDINISPSQGMVSYILQVAKGHSGLHNGQIFEVPLYDQRPIANFGAVTALVSNANATYHAFTAETQVHGLPGAGLRSLELRASYTFSRSIDDAPQTSATPSQDGQFDPFHNGYDKGLSNQQFPQRFSGSLMYGSHVASGAKLVRTALDGWRIAAIGIASSGAPYSYNIFGGTYLTGGRETINGSGGATYLPTIGRNTLRLAPRGTVNLRVSRELPLGHKLHLNAFAEAFNLFNAENISSVETRAFQIGTAATIGNAGATGPTPLIFQDAAEIATEGLTTEVPFGTPSSSTSGMSRERQVELGLRLQF